MLRRTFLPSVLGLLLMSAPMFGENKEPIQVLIITGDHGHQWKETTPFIKDLLSQAGMKVDVTETPAKDLTSANLAKYDVLFLNYKDTKKGGPDTIWSDDNKKAFTEAVQGGKGLVVYHHASSAFTSGSEFDAAFEKIIAGGWRKQGNHGKRHVFSVLPESVVLATAYSAKSLDAKNSGKMEPVVWVAKFGKGRVCENVLGHDVAAMKDLGFQTLLIRCVEWAARGEVQHPVPPELQKGKDGK